ncbi:MAG: rhomboid family intramembrane serine protease [Acidobacteriota bacterium]|nr:rhomboid family intramembrane serine protease [Acidobacteriota bacterium]
MRYDTRPRPKGFSFARSLPAGVKWLLIVNIALFILYYFGARSNASQYFLLFALVPNAVIHHLAIWQLFTYMFLHDPGGFGHILFNMLTLWMFGTDLERQWGTKRFLSFYFVCGVGAGICVVLINLLFGSMDARVIGASGAIYGLLMAFGLLYPDRTLLFSFLFPIKAKYFVMILGAIAFLSSFNVNGGLSNVAHLGGMLFGYAYLKMQFQAPNLDFIGKSYRDWKLQRAKKKFQVYMRKHDSDRGNWVQ